MAFDMKKLAEIAKPRNEIAKEKARFRKENRAWLRMSQEIAMCLHYYLRNNGMTQKEMADKMGVSPVYVNKLLKGGENLTLETICKIQDVIGESIISIAKPYFTSMFVKFTTMPKFSNNTVHSDTYKNAFQTQNDYASTELVDVA